MRHALWLSGVSFALHLAWESVQCPLLYVHGSYDATWAGMLRAAAGDVLLTWIVFACVAGASRSWRWDRGSWGALAWAVLLGVALALAVGVELRALAEGSWAYAPAMPVVPGLGVGLVPVAQLVLLTPASFRIAGRLGATGA